MLSVYDYKKNCGGQSTAGLTFDPDFGWITSQMALIDSWVSARSVAPTNVITAKQSSAYNHSVYMNELHINLLEPHKNGENINIQISSLVHRAKFGGFSKAVVLTHPLFHVSYFQHLV